ncbi:MAG TPA: hypothetical protein VF239_09820 [Vicinamibacterales bacterium]
MSYSAFGLSLAADWPIPGLLPHEVLSPPDVSVQLESPLVERDVADEEPYYAADPDSAGTPALQVWKTDSHYRLKYADGTQFILDRNGRHVRVIVAAGSTLEDAATYLLGPVIGFAMRLRGTTCLHASVVVLDGEAVAIAGPAGAGKSTTAACFSVMGHAVLSDDIAALAERDGTIHVEPAFPQIRLWPDSVAMLYGTPDALPPLTPNWDKRALPLSQPRAFHQKSVPLGAVYVLGEERAGTEPAIEPVSGSARMLALLANTYVGYLLDRSRRQEEFDALARVASIVEVRRVIRPAAPVLPALICQSILDDCRRRRRAVMT